VVAACRDCDIRLWQMPARPEPHVPRGAKAAPEGLRSPCPIAEELELLGHSGPVRSVDLQQTFVLSASDDTTARVWDLQACAEVVALGHPQGVLRALFFPGSTLLVTACKDRATRVWDLRASAERPTCVVQDAAGGAEGISFAARAGGLLACANKAGQVRFFDVPRCGALCATHLQLPSPARTMQFVLDTGFLACGCADGDLYTVQLEDFVAQALEVQPAPKRAVSLLRSFPRANAQALLAFAFESHGWGFGLLSETPPDEEPGLANPAAPP